VLREDECVEVTPSFIWLGKVELAARKRQTAASWRRPRCPQFQGLSSMQLGGLRLLLRTVQSRERGDGQVNVFGREDERRADLQHVALGACAVDEDASFAHPVHDVLR